MLRQCQTYHHQHHHSQQRQQRQQQRQNHQTSSSATTTTTIPPESFDLESTPMGRRMLHYFQWRESGATAATATTTTTSTSATDPHTTNSTTPSSPPSSPSLSSSPSSRNPCLRHEHAVWACRAIGTGCGAELAQLQSCFVRGHAVSDVVHEQSHTAYTKPNNHKSHQYQQANANEPRTIYCQAYQERMGQCIAREATALSERVHARKAVQRSS